MKIHIPSLLLILIWIPLLVVGALQAQSITEDSLEEASKEVLADLVEVRPGPRASSETDRVRCGPRVADPLRHVQVAGRGSLLL